MVCCVIPVWGAMQLMLGASVNAFATRNAILDTAAFASLYLVSLQLFNVPRFAIRALQILFVVAFAMGAVELAIPIGLFFAIGASTTTSRLAWGAMSATVAVSGILTASPTGCTILAIELLTVPMLLLWPNMRRPRMLGMAAFAALIAIIIPVAAERSQLLASAVAMTDERPWTGFGLGAFETEFAVNAPMQAGPRVVHAGNDWAEWAATGGLPLLGLYAALFALTVPRILRSGWGIGILAMFVHALFASPFEMPALSALAAILLGSLPE
jgi:O-antigen ligase